MMFNDDELCSYHDNADFFHYIHMMSVVCFINVLGFAVLKYYQNTAPVPKRKLSDPLPPLRIDVEQPDDDPQNYGPSRADSPYGIYHSRFTK